MDIAILYPEAGKYTSGGEIYNGYLYDSLEKNQAIFMDDKVFVRKKIKLAFFFNIIYILHIGKFKKINALVSDSRLYPRLFIFIPVLKLLNPKIKLILTHHHYNFLTQTSSFFKILHKFFERSVLSRADEIIVPSPYTKAMLSVYSHRKTDALRYLELGTRKEYLPVTEKKVGNKTQPKLLFLGQVYERKGIHLLIEALHYIKCNSELDFELNIVGNYDKSSNYFIKISRQIEQYKLTDNIHFRGRIPETELIDHLKNADIFVFPSLYEGFGMALTEAMEFCLPIVAFNNSAMPFTVKNGQTGILVENKNTQAFAEAIINLVSNDVLYKNLSTSCSLYVKELKTVKQMKQTFEEYALSLKF